MGRPPLNVQRMHINLTPEDVDRIDAVAGPHGRSKFIREAISQQLDRVAPADEKAGPPYFEHDGGHEPRLSTSGRATVFAILRKKNASLDQVQQAFGFTDPIDFIHALLGYRTLPDQATSMVVTQILGKLYDGE